jgi:DNA-binding NarL/FixJ family response regulator
VSEAKVPSKGPLRVVIAEDSGLLREGLARLLAEAGLDVVAKVGDGRGLISAAEQHRPDLAVVDVRMPPGYRDEGLRAAIEIRRRLPGLAVLVLSQYVEERYGAERRLPAQGPCGRRLRLRRGTP